MGRGAGKEERLKLKKKMGLGNEGEVYKSREKDKNQKREW